MDILKFKTNLKCGNCVKAIEPAMNSIKDVKYWDVDLNARPATLEVEADPSVSSEIINAVTTAGYRIEPI